MSLTVCHELSGCNSRRRLLLSLAAFGGVSLVNNRAGWSTPAALPVGIQLFTVSQSLQESVPGTLQLLRSIGFEEVETAGFAGLTARQFKAALDAAGLRCPSAHLSLTPEQLEASLEDAHTLGVRHVTSSLLRPGTGPLPDAALDPDQLSRRPGHLPPLAAMTLDDAKRTAALANRIGEAAHRAGLSYAYHNHYFEFADVGGGTKAYDILLAETDPAVVKFEIDCGWMIAAGADPAVYFTRYPGRFPMIHAKDFRPLPAGAGPDSRRAFMRQGTELGQGEIDYRRVIQVGRQYGLLHVFAEQEGPFDRLSQIKAAEVACRYLKGVVADS